MKASSCCAVAKFMSADFIPDISTLPSVGGLGHVRADTGLTRPSVSSARTGMFGATVTSSSEKMKCFIMRSMQFLDQVSYLQKDPTLRVVIGQLDNDSTQWA